MMPGDKPAKVTKPAKRFPHSSKSKARRWRAPAGAAGGGVPGLSPASLDASAPGPDSRIYPGPTVVTILDNTLGNLMPAVDFRMRTIIADNRYCAVSPGFILQTILTDPVLATPQAYASELFDCDDYVQYLKVRLSEYAAAQQLPAPLAVGYLFTTLHAFSFCIGDGAELFLINTQSEDHAVINDPALYAAFLDLSANNPITCIYL